MTVVDGASSIALGEPLRFVFDLQACQTEASAGRGVGRYAQSLALHALPYLESDDARFTLNAAYPNGIESVVGALPSGFPRSRLSTYAYPGAAGREPGSSTAWTAIGEILVRRHWSALQPDVLHVGHLSEGYVGEAVVPRRLPRYPGLIRAATLFDLIPLRLPDHYLRDPRFARWYHARLATMRECDHLLAISECSRRDAIELLDIDPARITTIGGAADAIFRPQSLSAEEEQAFRNRWQLKKRFVLYTGGDDPRKNLDGAIAGYAALPRELRRDTQLVIVCALGELRRSALMHRVRELELAPDDVVATGYVAEDELARFYSLCDAFVFPSLYEGFGLPVLEAMQCGAPALGADNSSIRELIARPDALFDPRDPQALAGQLARLLGDKVWRDELRASGLVRASAFSWARTAELAVEALREAHQRAQPRLSVSMPSRRRRLAVFTPLPPARSGIADFNAVFLPLLARYFDLDLYTNDLQIAGVHLEASFAIRHHSTFPGYAGEYDAIVYDIGGSEFHDYMLDLLARYPGIVVLHDAYLSGLYAYLEFQRGQDGRLTREMLYAHGPQARRLLVPARALRDGVGVATVQLPATKRVLEQAIGVISHTPFNRDLARRFFPEGWPAPYRVVPQVVHVPELLPPEGRLALRHELGYSQEDFIVCTFGHVVWTKCGDLLLQAFASAFRNKKRVKLVFVGELANDDFGRNLRRSIEESGIAARVTVTGYLDQGAYANYLWAADLAVQLRTHSRGGTPKGVLDCLAHRLPVIVNNAASYTDYPDDVVFKVPAEPDVAALAEAMRQLHARPAALARLGTAGRKHAELNHGGEEVARRFAQHVEEFIERGVAVSAGDCIREVGAVLARTDSSPAALATASRAVHSSFVASLFPHRRLLVDVSHIAAGDHETGIQRVVRNVVQSIYCAQRAGFRPVAVRLTERGLATATTWLEEHGVLTDWETQHEVSTPIVPQWGDCLLMLDSSWERYADFEPVFEQIRRNHGEVITAVYDLLPLRLPHCWPPGGAEWFKGWLDRAVNASDGLVCISRAVADDVLNYLEGRADTERRVTKVGYWHLGRDVAVEAKPLNPPSARIQEAFGSKVTFLMVGTLEPRKNHTLALDAFELMWAKGHAVALCIAGKQGWMVEGLLERIRSHPELGSRLHFIERPTDLELEQCYRCAAALLFPSAGEGFGLPVIEAASHSTPVIISDLPVLREIAADHATYCRTESPPALARSLEAWLDAVASGSIPRSSEMRTLTWDDSAEQLLQIVLDGNWYRRLP